LLVCLDAVATLGDWKSAYAAIPERHHIDSYWRIAWVGTKTSLKARYLSNLTTTHIETAVALQSFEVAVQDLWRVLCCKGLYPPTCSTEELLADAREWIHAHLGSLLAAHVSGDNPMTALPTSAIARKLTKLPLKQAQRAPEDQDDADDDPGPDLMGRCLEAALLGQIAALGSDEGFVADLCDALRPPRGMSVGRQRARIRTNLKLLIPRVDKAGETAALLFAYAWQIVTEGTLLKERAAPGTPYAYVQPIAQHVLEAFAGNSVSQLSEQAYEERFRSLVRKAEGKSPALAGLRGFHRFLRSWWEAPPLARDVFGAESETAVAANVIWPHEVDLMDAWLCAAPAVRVNGQVRVANAVASSDSIRSAELWALRCRDVQDHGDHFVIDIARNLKHGAEKTKEGRRRLVVRGERAIQILRAWMELRASEAALPKHLLFGTKDHPETVHERGKMYYLMNWLPKVATGDDSVSFHTHRHTVISLKLADCWRRRSEAEVSEVDQLAADAGHIHAAVSARFYGHLFEAAIRHRVDRAVFRPERQWAAKLAGWLDCSHDVLRQALSRAERAPLVKSAQEDAIDARVRVIGERFVQASPRPTSPDLASLCDTTAPPSPISTATRPVSLRTVWRLMRDVSDGCSPRTAATRNSVDLTVVTQLMALVGQFADAYGQRSRDVNTFDLFGQSALTERTGAILGCKLAYRADFVEALSFPSADDADRLSNLALACEYWKRNRQASQLMIASESSLLAPFLRQLRAFGIAPSAISVRGARACQDSAAAVQAAVLHIRAVFEVTVRQLDITRRAGRPGVYLVVAPKSSKANLRGHGASTLWLHSVMLAATVWTAYVNGDSDAA
jgi:integrase